MGVRIQKTWSSLRHDLQTLPESPQKYMYGPRPVLVHSFRDRLQNIWSGLRHDLQTLPQSPQKPERPPSPELVLSKDLLAKFVSKLRSGSGLNATLKDLRLEEIDKLMLIMNHFRRRNFHRNFEQHKARRTFGCLRLAAMLNNEAENRRRPA